MMTIERFARKIWEERERRFPPFTRMKWENGTHMAREATIQKAESRNRIAEPLA